jgi:hypothetical protein
MHIPPPPPTRVRLALDTECYPDYWLALFCTVDAPRHFVAFETYPGKPLDVLGLQRLLMTSQVVTFNGIHYDAPMIGAALMGYDCGQLKWLSDRIIQSNLKPWDLEREHGISAPPYLDHIDLKEILPGMHGLKMYMAKMHSRRIQELPIDPGASISPQQRDLLRQYCANDLDGVVDALRTFSKEIALRERMSAEYGIDLRSKSDAQIAEAVILHELGTRVERPTWALGTFFHYDPPPFIEYRTPMLQELLGMVRRARFVLGETGIEMPPELDSAKIKIGDSTYRLGIGGLHSSESSVYHIAGADTELLDVDVASYYPSLMLNSGAYPAQMGPAFLTVFGAIVKRRLAAKAAGDKTTADSLKITINGTFGKTLSKYGKLPAPKMGIQTTVTGQLSLLMLIEMLELCGIPVVSANTDGIVIKCPRSLAWLRDQIVKDWETRTGLETEATAYRAIYYRDVNSYVAIKDKDGSAKLKGAYAPTVPVGGSWPNPTGEICVDAVVAYLQHGTPLAQTITACKDIRKFVHVRNVKGGGVKYYGDEIAAASTKKGKREQLAAAGWVEFENDHWIRKGASDRSALEFKDAHKAAVQELRAANPVRKEYLGKVVRWYYAVGMPGAIRYKTTGNLVARTEGAKPLMELPDALPTDIDYGWYVTEAKSLITDLGVPML